ncbi:MAG: hypothetical protein UT34_C0002G0270 [candidate division WS6 bacterium GW2011_GWF2_39_15]|uniref:Uncharacterized protein n=1 Tax=candidate division WS6 bacterium GW2011_GWF2_39_15 TaxID=1619100 RepID=A0A0G0MRH6_9BACT|nr:MAG: hypothetical protein UT34_C0002G0270 [candidate division WS6 bacterium GW2011_GWF2_39_15]
MGKFLTFAVLIFFLAAVVAGGLWLKRLKDGEKSGPRIEDLRVCEFVSYNAPCEKDTKNVSQDNGDIYATVISKDITNSLLKTRWEYIQDGTKSIIGESEATIYDNQTLQLKLEKDLKRGWLLGKYAVTLVLEGSNTLTKEFTIVAD